MSEKIHNKNEPSRARSSPGSHHHQRGREGTSEFLCLAKRKKERKKTVRSHHQKENKNKTKQNKTKQQASLTLNCLGLVFAESL